MKVSYTEFSFDDKKRLFNLFYNGQMSGLEMVEEIEKEILEKIQATNQPTFEEVWKKKETEGWRYGEDALQNVKVGFELARKS